MFEPFTSRYFLGYFTVYPQTRPQAALHEILYDHALDYVEGSGPIVMKLENRHFTVQGDAAVPYGTLAVPSGLLDDLQDSISPAGENRSVLVARDSEVRRVAGL